MSDPRRCVECGVGTVRPLAIAGRRMPYWHLIVEVPEDLLIPTCDHCKAEWIDGPTADALDRALSRAKPVRGGGGA